MAPASSLVPKTGPLPSVYWVMIFDQVSDGVPRPLNRLPR
jgi:hypothetical protein